MEKTSMNIDENIESALTYVLVWLTGIIFLLLEKDNKTVKFHAWQSILTFLPLSILGWVISWMGFFFFPLIFVSYLFYLVIFLAWLFLMYKAYKGEMFKVPVVGDIAEQQANK